MSGKRAYRLIVVVFLSVVLTSGRAWQLRGQTIAAKKADSVSRADRVVFTNGDALTGRLVKVLDGEVTFHSDVVGDVTVPWSKIKTLDSAHPYAVIEKDQRVTRRNANDEVAVGSLEVAGDQIKIASNAASALVSSQQITRTIAVKNTQSIIDNAAFQKELQGDKQLLYGWTADVTLGATLVQGTDTNQTFTGAVSVARSIPSVEWLPLDNKATLNLSGTYGLLTQPEIISRGVLTQPASVAKTNILHGDAEYDKYVTPRLFGLVDASADHNFGSGLELQQTYGVGFGWSTIKNPKESLDLKFDVHYQQQQFYNGVTSALGTPNENLSGADLTEAWTRKLARGMKFNESVTLTPTFNVVQAYSGVANATLQFPVYKKLDFSLQSTDNYLGDPPEGYRRNTFQFTAGVTYVMK